jgi:dihydrofolate reductase
MASLLYSASMSLDGFIAGPGGDMSWLSPHFGPNPEADALVGDIGALLIGARTYRGDDPNAGTSSEGAFGGAWAGPSVVLTQHPSPDPPPDVIFAGDLPSALALALDAAGSARYVNVLGADVARQCLVAGVLDEVLIYIVPTLLGDGVRLLDQPGGMSVRLERTRLTSLPHATGMWFRVVR